MDKKNKVAVGYDLGERMSQISFCFLGGGEPESVSTVAGEERYDFPTLLGKHFGKNQWVYGKEAARLAESGGGYVVEDLPGKARAEAREEIDGESYEAVGLLALFLKKSLSLLTFHVPLERVDVLTFTVKKPDEAMILALKKAVEVMELKVSAVFFQSYEESFYYYTINQPKELWNHQTLVCDYRDRVLKTCRLEWNRRTVPVVAFAETEEHTHIGQNDGVFLELLEEICGDRIISSVYLIGKGFDGDWYSRSLRFLCRRQRVFRGNNLYSKGACFAGRERAAFTEMGKGYVFLGEEKVKANIGMKVMRRGQESYFALLDAGINWYEAERSCDFILSEGNVVCLWITPLTGGGSREVEIVLNDMPPRKENATRIHMELSMRSVDVACVALEDRGFGEIYPASGQVWREEIEI